MKRLALSMTILGVAWWLWTVRVINAANDRYIVAQFTNGTSQQTGGVNATLDLTVFNDIRNLSYPNHFIQWIHVTVPFGFTGSGPGGAFTNSDFIPPSGWSVSSIAGNVITFISASTDYTFNAGQSRTFLLKVHTPLATACPGTTYTFPVLGNQSTNGGNGNTYKYRPNAPLPTVAVTNCITPTYVVLNSVQPSSIFTTGNSQTVALKATLTTLAGHDAVGNPIAGAPIPNEPLTFNEGSAAITTCQEGATPLTNSSGVATCTYTPLTGPVTPLVAGNYDESASFAGDSVPFPPYGASNSSTKQLTVSATATSLTVPDASGPYGGSVNLTATLASGAGQTGISGQTITFYLNGSSVGPATTNNSGVATLNNVSIAGIEGGTYPGYIKASFAGNGTYDAITNYATLTVTSVGQTITFNGPPDQAFPNGSVGISATDSASLLVTFTSNDTSVCNVGTGTLNGSVTSATVSFFSLGLCSITASQSGNSSFGAATPVTQTFNIGNASMTCTLGYTTVIYTGLEQSPTCSTNVSGTSCKADNPQISAGSYPEKAVSQTAGYTCSGAASTGTFIINKATPTITWNNPADITYGTALGATQLNATASVAGTFVYTPASGTVQNAGSGQTLHVVFTPTDTGNYNTASKDVTINVLKATPTITWNNPADITYGTALGATQLNATASVAGSFVYTPAASTVLDAGAGQTLHAAFTPTDTGNYNTASKDVTINVLKATPTITWNNPADITYGTALGGTQLNATASVAGSFVYTPAAGTVLNTGAGQTLHADFTPTDTANYNTASKDATINVLKATPIITWNNPADISYGTALGSTQLNATAPVAGSFVYTPASGTVLNAGSGQILHVAFTPTDTANYNTASKDVTINVTGADQSITFRSFIVAATATSGGAVTFSSGDVSICTVAATDPPTNQTGQYTAVVTLVGSNTDWTKCTVLANQAGNDNYKPAAPATAILGNPNP